MASTETGELYTQEQYDTMSEQERIDLGMVALSPAEQELLLDLDHEERMGYLADKKPRKVKGAYHDPRYTKNTYTTSQRRKANKVERQRRKQGRH